MFERRMVKATTVIDREAERTSLSRLKALERIVNRSRAIVFRWHAEPRWRVEFVSDSVRGLGYCPRDFLSGRVTWPGITHPDDRPRVQSRVNGELRNGVRSFSHRYRLIDADGRIRWVEDQTTALAGAGGRITHLQGMLIEITDYVLAEEALRNSESRYRGLVERAPDGIVTCDEQWRVIDVNPSGCRMLGCAPEAIVGRPLGAFVPGDELEKRPFRREALARGEVVVSTRRVRRADGGELVVESRSQLLPDGRVLAFVRDVTERRRAQEALIEVRERLEERVRKRTAELERVNRALRTEIAEHRAAEAELRDSNEYLDAVIHTSHEGIVVLDDEGRFEFHNEAALRIFGRSGKEMAGCRFLDTVPAECRDAMAARLAELCMRGKCAYETEIVTGDGERRLLLASHRQMKIADRRQDCVVVQDITGRRRVEEELRRHRDHLEERVARRTADLRASEENFRALAENAGEAIMIEDERRRLLYANAASVRLLGYPAEQLVKMTADELVSPGYRSLAAAYTQRRLAGEDVPDGYRINLLAQNGREIPVEVAGAPTVWRGQAATIGMMRDIRGRLRIEKELRESESRLAQAHGEMQQLARHLQDAREAERSRIAYEIHDELGQALTALKMDLHWIQSRVRDDPRLKERVTTVMGIADSTIQSIKRLSTELKPALLEDEGLAAAVEWHIEELKRRAGLRCDTDIRLPHRPGAALATAAFRVVQEALTNVVRHAGASRVWVRIRETRGRLRVVVADNGAGFHPGAAGQPGSLGIIGMRERAATTGGRLRIRSREGAGTIVAAVLPLDTVDNDGVPVSPDP